MKLWLISQTQNNNYDTYDSAVVSAPDENSAKNLHPSERTEAWNCSRDWCDIPNDVTAVYLGEAPNITETKVILASFNAG